MTSCACSHTYERHQRKKATARKPKEACAVCGCGQYTPGQIWVKGRQMELQLLNPSDIQWPELRVTAYYQDGQEEMLRENLAAMGQQQPIVVIKVGDKLFGTDGLHRCLMAMQRGDPTVPCVVREGEEKDVFMSNLVLNSLRGRTKASEQVAVLGELFDGQGVTIDELEAKTGHSRDWVERMITVSRAAPIVRQSLDDELISLGHAYALARLEAQDMQERICHQLLVYRWSVKELEGHIKNALAIKQAADPQPAAPEPQKAAGVVCGFCKQERESRMVQMLPVCVSCGGALIDGLTAQHRSVN